MLAQLAPIDAVSYLKEFGLFAAFSAIVVWLSVKGFSWCAVNIGVPLITKHFRFVDDLIILLDKIQCSLSKLSENQEIIAERQQSILDRLNEMEVVHGRDRTRKSVS